MPPSFPLVSWLPLVAVALHLVEEFAWPGGFADWYRDYRPERAASGLATAGMLVRAAVIGPAYHLYAAWNHRRRAARMAAGGA